jgi:quinol monooxygenase YgiN
MYGTVARIHPKPGREKDLRSVLEEWARERGGSIPGNRGGYLFEPDKNPYERPTAFLIAVFDDDATYRANADDPAQDAWYRRLRETLDDDPDWMDGTFVRA